MVAIMAYEGMVTHSRGKRARSDGEHIAHGGDVPIKADCCGVGFEILSIQWRKKRQHHDPLQRYLPTVDPAAGTARHGVF